MIFGGSFSFLKRQVESLASRYNILNEAEAAQKDKEVNSMNVNVNFSAEYLLKFEGPTKLMSGKLT